MANNAVELASELQAENARLRTLNADMLAVLEAMGEALDGHSELLQKLMVKYEAENGKLPINIWDLIQRFIACAEGK